MGPGIDWHGKGKGKGKEGKRVIIGSRVGDIIDGGFTHVLRRVGDWAAFLLPLLHRFFLQSFY